MSLNTDPKIATHIAHSYSHKELLTPTLIYIWNAEVDELEQLVDEILGRLPVSSHMNFEELCHIADHSMLREMKAHIELLLEAPCKTDDCREDCNDYYRSANSSHQA